MFRLLFINIKNFILNNKFLFLLFMVTLTVVSFSGLFILNIMGRNITSTSELSCTYFIEFDSEQDLSLIEENLSKSGLFPAKAAYFNSTAASYLTFKVGKPAGSDRFELFIRSEKPDGRSPVGVYTEKCRSVYLSQVKPAMLYGNDIDDFASKNNVATVSYHLDPYINDGKINVGGVLYDVYGCYKEDFLFSACSVKVAPEIFSANGHGVLKAYFMFNMLPIQSSIEKFEDLIRDNIVDSNSVVLECFGLNTIFQIISSLGVYAVLFLCLLAVDIIMFHCWVSSSLRTYSLYILCGMDNFKMKVLVRLEMLVYTLFTGCIGSVLFYALISAKYKPDVFYPPFIFVFVNLIILYFFSSLIASYHLLKAKSKPSIFYI